MYKIVMKVLFFLSVIWFSIDSFAQKELFCHSSQYTRTAYADYNEAPLADNGFLWYPGSTISINIMNGSKTLKEQMMSIAAEWEKYANIHFRFVDAGDSHVRIIFDGKGFHWAAIGVQSNMFPQAEATIEIDSSFFKSEELRRATVLHMFGHILGLRHENAVPKKERELNLNAIKQTFSYSTIQPEALLYEYVEPYSVSASNSLIADNKSIMHIPLPKSWTANKPSPINLTLSTRDKTVIGHLYPFENKKKVEMYFNVGRFGGVTIENSSLGLSFYPVFDIQIKDAPYLHFSILLFDESGKAIPTDNEKYQYDEQLGTAKSFVTIPPGNYSLNKTMNDFGLFLPYTYIPSAYRGKKLKAVFKVNLPGMYNFDSIPGFNSKPFYISVPK
jgi:hypothetical protein